MAELPATWNDLLGHCLPELPKHAPNASDHSTTVEWSELDPPDEAHAPVFLLQDDSIGDRLVEGLRNGLRTRGALDDPLPPSIIGEYGRFLQKQPRLLLGPEASVTNWLCDFRHVISEVVAGVYGLAGSRAFVFLRQPPERHSQLGDATLTAKTVRAAHAPLPPEATWPETRRLAVQIKKLPTLLRYAALLGKGGSFDSYRGRPLFAHARSEGARFTLILAAGAACLGEIVSRDGSHGFLVSPPFRLSGDPLPGEHAEHEPPVRPFIAYLTAALCANLDGFAPAYQTDLATMLQALDPGRRVYQLHPEPEGDQDPPASSSNAAGGGAESPGVRPCPLSEALDRITLVLDLPDVSHEPRELVSVRIVPRDDDDAAAAEDQPKWRTARLRRPRLHASVTITEEMLQVYEKVVWRGTLTRGTNGEVVPVVAKAVDADEFDELRREVDAYDRLRSSGLVGDVAPHLLGVFATRRRVGWAALLMTDEGDALPDRGMGWTKDVDISEAESEQLGRKIRALHKAGLDHGSLDPRNVVRSPTTGDLTIVDFGNSALHDCDAEECEEVRNLVPWLKRIACRAPEPEAPLTHVPTSQLDEPGGRVPLERAAGGRPHEHVEAGSGSVPCHVPPPIE